MSNSFYQDPSEIPFDFVAIPIYFRVNGYFKDPKNFAFIYWCFDQCSPEEQTIEFNHHSITLKPYQFVFSRPICAQETGLTENEVRTQQKRWEEKGLLIKPPNKTPNRFTLYEWVIESFEGEGSNG